jgi:hypothetical protein
MAIRTDKVQLDIEFITDESKQFAKSILDTKALTSEIDKAKKELRDYERELQKTTLSEAKRTEILGKQADAEKRVADNLTKIAEEAKKTASIDLTKLAPAQLIERAKQLEQTMKLIPTHAPAYGALVTQLKATNDRIATLRTETRGVAAAMDEAGKKGSLFARVMGGAMSVFTGISVAGVVANVVTSIGSYLSGLFETGKGLTALSDKTISVFGEATTIVQGFAEKTAKSLGFTQKEFVGLATGIGDLLVPMGFMKRTAAELSSILVTQGGILSKWSLGKLSGAETTEILQKALLGERDALNSVGIDVKQSMIDDELKRRGLENLTGSSLRQAEALITLDFIMKQSTSANEGFARSSESLSRSTGLLNAMFKEFGERIGSNMVALYKSLVGGVASLVTEQESLTDATRQTQIAFNAEIEILKEGNFTSEERAGLIGQINEKYKEYLPNLIDEKASIDEITTAQRKSNEMFEQKMLYVAMEEEIAAVLEKSKVAAKEAYLSEVKRADAKRKLLDNSLTQDEGRYITFLEQQQELNTSLRESSLEVIKNTPNEIAAIEKNFGQIAERLGTTLDNLRLKFGRKETKLIENEINRLKKSGEKEIDELSDAEKRAIEKAAEIQKAKDYLQGDLIAKIPAAAIGGRGRPDNLGSQVGAAGGANADRLAEEANLREKFRNLLNMEEEFEVEMSAIQVAKADDRLRMLRDNGLTETQEYQKALDAKLKAQENHAQAVEDLERRTHEYKKFTLSEGLSMSSDALDVAIDLLSKDEAARKKNAAAIRAFQIAQVITNGVLEVQKIWASVAEFGPLAPIVGGVLTAFAVGRSVASIQRIRSQKFARGGTVGFFGGNSHSAGGTQGYFSDGTQIEVEKDEAFAIVNKRNAPMLRFLSAVNSYGGNGVPYDRPGGSYFAQGGIPRLNTTPNGGKQQSAPVIPSIEQFVAAVDRFERIVAGFPREVRSSVNYFDVKKAGETIRDIQNEAGV